MQRSRGSWLGRGPWRMATWEAQLISSPRRTTWWHEQGKGLEEYPQLCSELQSLMVLGCSGTVFIAFAFYQSHCKSSDGPSWSWWAQMLCAVLHASPWEDARTAKPRTRGIAAWRRQRQPSQVKIRGLIEPSCRIWVVSGNTWSCQWESKLCFFMKHRLV